MKKQKWSNLLRKKLFQWIKKLLIRQRFSAEIYNKVIKKLNCNFIDSRVETSSVCSVNDSSVNLDHETVDA